MKKALMTIDVEQDCPPFLSTMNGIKQGMPALLNVFAQEKISATFFTTGKIAEQFPEIINKIVSEGHELGCHGYTHRRFDQMTYDEAEYEIKTSAQVLRQYAPVISFRAPNLKLPEDYLPILSANGFQFDSSIMEQAALPTTIKSDIQRIKISSGCSCFRLPLFLSTSKIKHLDTAVLFAHPWEFIDMSKTHIPFSCRFHTGNYAIKGLKKWISFLKKRNYFFLTVRELKS